MAGPQLTPAQQAQANQMGASPLGPAHNAALANQNGKDDSMVLEQLGLLADPNMDPAWKAELSASLADGTFGSEADLSPQVRQRMEQMGARAQAEQQAWTNQIMKKLSPPSMQTPAAQAGLSGLIPEEQFESPITAAFKGPR